MTTTVSSHPPKNSILQYFPQNQNSCRWSFNNAFLVEYQIAITSVFARITLDLFAIITTYVYSLRWQIQFGQFGANASPQTTTVSPGMAFFRYVSTRTSMTFFSMSFHFFSLYFDAFPTAAQTADLYPTLIPYDWVLGYPLIMCEDCGNLTAWTAGIQTWAFGDNWKMDLSIHTQFFVFQHCLCWFHQCFRELNQPKVFINFTSLASRS